MAGIGIFVANLADGAVAGRKLQLRGTIAQFRGRVQSVSVQFGVGGPSFGAFFSAPMWTWRWDGFVPNVIRAGQAFPIIVTAKGFMNVSPPGDPEPNIVDVDGTRTLNVVLENVTPVLAVVPMQSPIVVTQLPYALILKGSATEGSGSGAPYSVQKVQVQVDNGVFADVTPVAPGDWSQWTTALSLPAGTHHLVVRAFDSYESATVVQREITVYGFTPPDAGPGAEKTLSGVSTSSSITSWSRLEPQNTEVDIGLTTRARLFDPLWLMARQWQMGEFQAEDAGTPAQARVRATNAMLTRCRFGPMPANTQLVAPVYDPKATPLEAVIERRPMRPGNAGARMLPLAVEAGLHFLRLLELDTTGKRYRAAFAARYTLQPLNGDDAVSADAATARFMQTMVGRAMDARRLVAAFRTAPGMPITFDAELAVTPTDVTAMRTLALAWLAWFDGLFAEPAGIGDDAWDAPRLEYALTVATRLSPDPFDEVSYSADEFDGSLLDWSSFDANAQINMGTADDRPFVSLNETTVPAPITIPGTPAPRFWEMEDARVAYGLMPTAPTDLAQLMMIEYAGSYGNDWYTVPLTVPVGSVTRVDSLIVTDTFGVKSLLRRIGDRALPRPFFSMWQPASIRYAGDAVEPPTSNQFFLPPTLGQRIQGEALEDVLLMRDEMANVAWAIERSVENAVEHAKPRYEGADGAAPPGQPPSAPTSRPRYVLASHVAPNWIPLLPVQLQSSAGGLLQSRLRRGAVLQPDGSQARHPAQGDVLNARPELLLFDEEVPREGVHITRQRRMARWIDGSLGVDRVARRDRSRRRFGGPAVRSARRRRL